MLDIKNIRANTEEVIKALEKRNKGEELAQAIHRVLELDGKKRELLTLTESLKAERNKVSKEIPAKKKAGEDVQDLLDDMKQTAEQIKQYDEQIDVIDVELNNLLSTVPNTPHETVPAGADDTQNKFIRDYLKPTEFDFTPKSHWELGAELKILDPETAAKVTGTRFMFYYRDGARLERSVANLMLNTHTDAGYEEVIPPYLVNAASMYGTGQLPKFAEDAYHTTDGLYLIPTAEVPVTNMYRDQILDGKDLPLSYVAGSPCFRSEAGSAGRDTKGLIRQHQFHKVELVKFSRPDNSYDELESLTAEAEKILRLLKLPYRVVMLCGGDLGFSSAKTYDIEVWMPSYNRYVEISSCSDFEDFQARRANIRFRDADGKLKFVHTLNGSGLAVGRTVAAIMENYQRKDGSIAVPDALKPYFGKDEIKASDK